MPTSAVIYCRTATTTQREPDREAQRQEQLCSAYAEKHRYEIVEVFNDLGVSGLSKHRSGFNALLNFLGQRSKPPAVLVVTRDRIARDLGLLLEMEKVLSDLNAPLVIVNEVVYKAA